MAILGLFLILLGIVYLVKPDLFQRGVWKKTAISQQVLSEGQNKTYMRVLGIVLIVIGIVFVIMQG